MPDSMALHKLAWPQAVVPKSGHCQFPKSPHILASPALDSSTGNNSSLPRAQISSACFCTSCEGGCTHVLLCVSCSVLYLCYSSVQYAVAEYSALLCSTRLCGSTAVLYPSPVDGRLSDFRWVAVVNSAAVDICVCR